MKLLLDTHIFLWWNENERLLSKVARELIHSSTEVYVSSVSIWETAIKAKQGKLLVDVDDLINVIERSGFCELPFTARHAANVNQLPKLHLHKDPFDRALVAQAITEPLRFLTADKTLQKYSELVSVV